MILRAGICLWAALSAPSRAAGEAGDAMGFVKRHCLECHDDTARKGGISLASLNPDLGDESASRLWIRAHDQVSRGAMPPTNAVQPTLQERNRWLDDVFVRLTRSIEDRRASEGRAPMRRLSRTELQNTLSTLSGVSIDLTHVLPEENSAGGFLRVGDALEISPQHLLGFQKAADIALDLIIPTLPWSQERTRLTGAEWLRSQRQSDAGRWRVAYDWATRISGSGVLLFKRSTHHDRLEIPVGTPARPGRYLARARLAARQNRGEPLSIALILGGYDAQSDPTLQRILDIRDVPSGDAVVIEIEVDVPANSPRWTGRTVRLVPWSLPQQPVPAALEAERLLGNKPEFDGPALLVEWVEWEGPMDAWPGTSYQRFFGNLPLENRRMLEARAKEGRPNPTPWRALPASSFGLDPCRVRSTDPQHDCDKVLRAALPWIFRRPPTQEELADYQERFRSRMDAGKDFHAAIRHSLKAALCSAPFMFLASKPGPLDSHGLASRLSYLLWSRPPDQRLMERASMGGWTNRAGLLAEVDRMLDHRASQNFVSDFSQGWLELHRLHETTPDRAYGEFDDNLLWSMPLETLRHVERMLREDRKVDEWVASDWSYLNERLATHYSVPNIHGMELRRANWPLGSPRGGVITHASILKLTANGTSTSPVRRGAWILDRMLGTPPSPPPPGTPAIDPDLRGAVTIRQQLDQHRQHTSCNRCHRHIDPPGLALENFDVIGGWRDWYRVVSSDGSAKPVRLPHYPALTVWKGLDVEQGFTTSDGMEVRDIRDFRHHLLEQRRRIALGLVQNLITFGTGAAPDFGDRDAVQGILDAAEGGGFGMKTLLKEVIASRMFLEQ